MSLVITRPHPSEYPPYFDSYISLIKGDDIIKTLNEGIPSFQMLISLVTEHKENFRYAPGKWTLKEVIGHMTDVERIMSYRALSFARGERMALPGFDENDYVKNANFSKRALADLAYEFTQLRTANVNLFRSFDQTVLDRKGIANGKEINVRAILFVIAGHQIHHTNIIQTRYLV